MSTQTKPSIVFRPRALEPRIDLVRTSVLGGEGGVRLYGRDRELGVLGNMVDRASEGGGAVVVRGEAGIAEAASA
jgi:hypothetical protein